MQTNSTVIQRQTKLLSMDDEIKHCHGNKQI